MLRVLAAEAIGPFALVFAGCGTIGLDAMFGGLAYRFVRGEQA